MTSLLITCTAVAGQVPPLLQVIFSSTIITTHCCYGYCIWVGGLTWQILTITNLNPSLCEALVGIYFRPPTSQY